MGNMNNREFMAWQYWLDEQLNIPSRADHYAMQNTAEIRGILSKNPSSVKLSDFKLKFKSEDEKPVKSDKSKLANWAKSKWSALTGLGR